MRNSSGAILGAQSWAPVKLGGLGFVTEIVHASDGSLMFCRTDVGGAYRRESSASAWTPIISSAHMILPVPSSIIGLGHDHGVIAIASAPSDPSVAYMTLRGRMMRSVNRGVDWVDDSLNGSAGLYMGSNDTAGATNGFNVKNTSNKLVVDPTNPAVAYFGSQNNGGWRRLSGAWAQIAGLPVAVGGGSGDRTIIFQVDNTSALTGSGATSRRSIVYASVNGYGLYLSTDGGTTFSSIADATTFSAGNAVSCTTNSTTTVTTASTSGLVAGMSVTGANIPAGTAIASITNATTFVISNAATSSATLNLTFRAAYKSACIVCDQNGLLYLCVNNAAASNVWKWNGSAWTQITTPWFIAFLAVDPKDATRILGRGPTGPVRSSNSGATWVGQWTSGENATVATDCPMPAAVVQAGFSAGQSAAYAQIAPHPVEAKDYIANGYGVFYIPSPWPTTHGTGANRLIWHEFCAGIEEMVAEHVVITPRGKTFLLGQDRGIILQNPSGYASVSYPASALACGFSTDWACDDENYMAVICNGEIGGSRSGFSTNEGLSFTPFPVQAALGAGGCLAVGNVGNIVWMPGQNTVPVCSFDSFTNWQFCTFAGFPQVGRVTYGTGNAALTYMGVSIWLNSTLSGYKVSIAAASGSPSVSYNSATKTITVVPDIAANTATAIAAQINADPTASTLITATAGGTGAGTPAVGAAALGFETGWGFGSFNTRRTALVADKLNPGTFYMFNYKDWAGTSMGLWKSTDGGATWVRVNSTSIINPLFAGFHAQLRMDRGILYLCPGESGGTYDGDVTNLTYRSEDGGATWTVLGELYEINLFAIGAPAPESSVHTLYALGWKTIASIPTFGLYRSLNKGATWTALNNSLSFDHAYALGADPSVFGRLVVGRSGTGFEESNDNGNLLIKAA